MIATKTFFYKSPIHEKCAYCPYKILKSGERSDSLKSFSGDHIKTANKIDAPKLPTALLSTCLKQQKERQPKKCFC